MSPEPSPVENARQFMRDDRLCDRVLEWGDDIVDYCSYARNKLVAQPRRLRPSVCSIGRTSSDQCGLV